MIDTMASPSSSPKKRKIGEADVLKSSDDIVTSNGSKGPSVPQSYVSKLIFKMKECLEELGAKDVDLPTLEVMSVLIYESMSISSRNYHSVQHVFDISATMKDPIPILSALFHDCIYFHVDKQLTKSQSELLQGTHTVDGKGVHLFSASSDSDKDELLKMVECIFSYSPGQEIKKGLNEFLSAVIAVRSLKPFLLMHQLASIACCIEATIPFRAEHPDSGLPNMEHLYQSLGKANIRFDLKMTEEDRIKAIQRAVTLSNNDVQNFAYTDVYDFLDGTWSLLPEQNENLRMQFCITTMDMQKALHGMYEFFQFHLKPENVFDTFRGIPSKEELDWKVQLCTRNVTIAKKYVGAKLFAMSVVAAFARLTGGDAPISLFLGDLQSNTNEFGQPKFSDFLPSLSAEQRKNSDQVVFRILQTGRKTEAQFDTKNSPLAAYLCGSLGDDLLMELLQTLKLVPMEEDTALLVLKSLPRDILKVVAEALRKIAWSRSSKIKDVVERLYPTETMPQP
eukprot:scaffold2563_cov124-Cylindrotheca_fusiformis.AAC.24